MPEKRLTTKADRMDARRTRDSQWEFMERVAREGVVWVCPWDKKRRHGADGVHSEGLLCWPDFSSWLESHKDWWRPGRWSERRCAFSVRLTDAGRAALSQRELYDMEPIHGGLVEPGFVVTPWPKPQSGGE